MNDILTVAIDSGVENGSIALLEGSLTIATWQGQAGGPPSGELVPSIASLLHRHGFGPESIGRIAVSRGPGSFTGLRVGIATAMGLSRALSVPCIGIDLLKAFYLEHGELGPLFCAIPIGRNGICWQYFKNGDAKTETATLCTGQTTELIEILNSNPQTKLLAHTSVIALLTDETNKPLTNEFLDLGANMAVFVGRASITTDDGLEPIYARTMTFRTRSGEDISQ